MKNLGNANDRQSILARLQAVQPERQCLWGGMSPHQMLCHLSDAYLIAMGQKKASMAASFFQRTVVKFVALQVPMHWPKGFATRPEMKQGAGGTPPGDFEEDRRKLAATIHRFCASSRDFQWAPNPIFGAMSDAEWMRWGYLHADHHFRQFSRSRCGLLRHRHSPLNVVPAHPALATKKRSARNPDPNPNVCGRVNRRGATLSA